MRMLDLDNLLLFWYSIKHWIQIYRVLSKWVNRCLFESVSNHDTPVINKCVSFYFCLIDTFFSGMLPNFGTDAWKMKIEKNLYDRNLLFLSYFLIFENTQNRRTLRDCPTIFIYNLFICYHDQTLELHLALLLWWSKQIHCSSMEDILFLLLSRFDS